MSSARDRRGGRIQAAGAHARLAWGALWRAQAVHVAVFAVGPIVLALLQVAWALVSLPFLLVGAGSREVAVGVAVKHLASPGCWVALAPCALAQQEVFDLGGFGSPSTGGSADAAGGAGEPLAIDVRQLWFALWLVWLVVFLVQRERRSRAGVPGSADG